MENAAVYFKITALSYPFLALSGAGAAFYRASGNSKLPTKVSVLSNVLNIGGNALFIYGFQWGAAGAALATLLARFFCMAVILYRLRMPGQTIVVRDYFKIRPDMNLIFKILAIGVPAGIENGMFQFGKLAIASTVSTLGTVAISAQAMTDTLETVNGIFSNGVGIGLMTVVKPLLWVGAFGIPYGLRAAGDVKFPMLVSVTTMWCLRVALGVCLVRVFGLGLAGVWIGMFADWGVRAAVFWARFVRGKRAGFMDLSASS